MKTLIMIVLLSMCFVLGCNSNATDPPAGDTDASELELDAEADSGDADITDTSSDGDELDADAEAAEAELPDGDDDIDAVEDELDSDFVDSDVVEAEEEIEAEWEEGDYPPLNIENLPFEGVTISPCEEPLGGEEKYLMNQANLVWGNGTGKIFIGGQRLDRYNNVSFFHKNIFWIYDKNNKTLTCDPMIEEEIFALDGTTSESGAVLWLGLKNKLAKRDTAGEWSFVSIPDAGEITIPDDLLAPSGLHIGPDGWIAVWDSWGLGFYNEQTQVWKMFDWPEFVEQPTILEGRWHGDKFYLPLGCKVFSWHPDNEVLVEEAVITGCDDDAGDGLYVIDKDDNEIQMSQVNWVKGQSSYGAVYSVVQLNLETKMQSSTILPNMDHCSKEFDPTVTIKPLVQFIVPGMAGIPPASFLSGTFYNHNHFMCYQYINIRLGSYLYEMTCNIGEIMIGNYCGANQMTLGNCYNYPNNDGNTSCYDVSVGMLFQKRAWRDGEALWIGATRVAQDESD